MDIAEVVDDILLHYGAKGMKWGVRKQYNTSSPTSSGSNSIKGLEHFPKAQAASMSGVAKKMEKSYGLKIDEFVPLSARETKRGYIGYVNVYGKDGLTVVHMSNNPNLKSKLDNLNKQGIFAAAPGKPLEANLTHESAHALFHQVDVQKTGFMKSKITPGKMEDLRDSAWNKAKAQAVKDGDYVPAKGFKKLITPGAEKQMGHKISKYAENSLFVEEIEAEVFTAYHWSPNPPKFVDTFMKDVHSGMGQEIKPFSGRKV